MLRYSRDAYAAILSAARTYGDPFTWPSPFGKLVVVGDPAAIRTLFTADPAVFEVPGAEVMRPVIGQSNLILLHGDQHRAMRKLQTPPFHGARMHVYGPLSRDIVHREAERWADGRPFCMHASAQEISLQIILQAVFGLGTPEAQREFKAAMRPRRARWPGPATSSTATPWCTTGCCKSCAGWRSSIPKRSPPCPTWTRCAARRCA
jgi:cytochrome P450